MPTPIKKSKGHNAFTKNWKTLTQKMIFMGKFYLLTVLYHAAKFEKIFRADPDK